MGAADLAHRGADLNLEEGDRIAPGRTVVRSLGGGSRFEVALVWDDHLWALAVAKVLRPGLRDDVRALRDLTEEAETLEYLAHPAIVRGFAAVLNGAFPHLLLEHLEGPTLRRLIRRDGPVPLERLLPLAAHVAAALSYMARMEMVHLHVKPGNIVMGVPPRLIDLSIARPFERADRIRSPIGTEAYMAPEQCAPGRRPASIGPATDVWALGATLHHAVSGAVPFPRPPGARESPYPAVRFPQLTGAPAPLPQGVPPAVQGLISGCLAANPDHRPTAPEVVESLARAAPYAYR